MKKGKISSPMTTMAPPSMKGNPGVYDRHTEPCLSKPRDMGKDAVPTIFFTNVPGTPAKVSTPLKDTLAQGTFAKYKP